MPTDLVTNNTLSSVGDWPPRTTNYWNVWQPFTPTMPLTVWPAWGTYTVPVAPRCAWCQGQHYGKCENLKSVTYRKDGTVARVEFFGEDE